MRVAFPYKVFLSYLFVISVAAIPTYIYIQTSLANEFVSYRLSELGERVAKWAGELREIPPHDRVATVRRVAEFEAYRVSYIDAGGVVKFDSAVDAKKLMRQNESPEYVAVRGAEDDMSNDVIALGIPGVAAHQRFSAVADAETLFVAARIDDGERAEVIRIAYPFDDAATMSDALTVFFRNAQAMAITIAFLLSFLAAFVFMRPLQRLVRSANAIADGDFDASETWDGDDEISDVGNALNKLALELRQRLSFSEASRSILLQAIDYADTPMAVLSPTSEILVVNGAFREMLGDSINAEDAVAKLVSSKKWNKALERAATTVEPIELSWAHKKIGQSLSLFLLDTANSEPMSLLSSPREMPYEIPAATDVESVAFSEILGRAQEQSGKPVAIAIDPNVSSIEIVECGRRVELALALIWDAASGEVELHASASPHHLELWFTGEVGDAALQTGGALVHPMGGDMTQTDDDVVITLRRA